MPPKRATRATTRPRDATPERPLLGTRDTIVDVGDRLAGPPRYSTMYGSPVTVPPIRLRNTFGRQANNLEGAVSNVLATVARDNQQDGERRTERASEERRRRGETPAMRRNEAEQRRQEEEAERRRQEEEARAAEQAERERAEATRRQLVAQAEFRSRHEQPVGESPVDLLRTSRPNEATPSPPSNNPTTSAAKSTGTIRSFIEESMVFGNATVNARPPHMTWWPRTVRRIAAEPGEEGYGQSRSSLRQRTPVVTAAPESSAPTESSQRQRGTERDAAMHATVSRAMRDFEAANRSNAESKLRRLMRRIRGIPVSFPNPVAALRNFVRQHGGLWSTMSKTITFFVLGLIACSAIWPYLAAWSGSSGGSPFGDSLQWYGTEWLDRFIPYGFRHPLDAISDEEFSQLNLHWGQQAKKIAGLEHSKTIHEKAIEKLNRVLPKVVKMDLDKNGKPVISQEFWHALKELLVKDRDVFTLDKKDGRADDITDLQWTVLRKRIEKDGLNTAWESWMKRNAALLRDLVGPVGANPTTDAEILKLVERQLKSKELKNIVMTRDEFIKHLQTDFMTNRREIRGELADLETRLMETIKQTAQATAQTPPIGLTKKEIAALVEKTVSKSIGDAQLAAMAKGKINANWASELNQQVNFFSLKAGAIVNDHLSSPTFRRKQPKFGSLEYFRQLPNPGAEKFMALERWEEQGDCWCAHTRGIGGEPQPADFAVNLGRAIIPTHVVIEHIARTATLDPGAMPRDMEVWMYVAEVTARRDMENWSLATFPATDVRHPLMGRGLVKIAEFRYDDVAAGRGSQPQVFQMPAELKELEAATDHVLVRALDNYGGEDHTCFYRVRLYGDQVPDEAEAKVGA